MTKRAQPGDDDNLVKAPEEATTSFGPARASVVGAIAAGIVFVIVLEFLVLISFVGQRLWRHPDFGSDFLFTLPMLLWLGVAVVGTLTTIRIVSSWFRVTPESLSVRGLIRRQRTIAWSQVAKIFAVHEITRKNAAVDVLDRRDDSFDLVVLLDERGKRLASAPSRFFDLRTQEAILVTAREAGVEVIEIQEIRPKELRTLAPKALSWLDAHPTLMLLFAVLFYLGHYVLTFAVWGL